MKFSRDLKYEWTAFKGKLFRKGKEAVPRNDIESGNLRTSYDAVLWMQRSNAPASWTEYAYTSLLGNSIIPYIAMLYF